MFTRSPKNPILSPRPENDWESWKLYNPGAIHHDGRYHLFYRAVGRGDDWHSAIGYAVSDDGEVFERFDTPLLDRDDPVSELKGLEDPRITRVDDTFYMAYAVYDGKTPRLCIATSPDLKTWTKHGPALTGFVFDQAGGEFLLWDDAGKSYKKEIPGREWSKSGAIFPEKIGGKFHMLFGEYRIWHATSDDGLKWQYENTPFLAPRSGEYFDNVYVEMGPPPIRTEQGWLVLYHGIDDKIRYRLGILLLGLDDPRKIIYRSEQPIFGPEAPYEFKGIVDIVPGGLKALEGMDDATLAAYLNELEKKGAMPKVTFCCGATVVAGVLRIYYGASDTFICTATAPLADVLKLA